MACDRIEGILQSIFHTQEAAGPTKCLTSHRGRIPSYDQDSDGEIEGTLLQLAIYLRLDISRQANDWGALSRTLFYLFSFVVFILPNRDHD